MDPREWQSAERFLEHLQLERRLSGHTVASYRRDLSCLATFCDRNEIAKFEQLQTRDIRGFAAASHAAGLSPKSIQRRLSGVRSFLKYLIREGRLAQNAAVGVSAPKAARTLPGTLDVDQMARLLDIRGSEPATLRDRAMLELFEGKLQQYGNLGRAAIELAKDWRTDRRLRRLEALLCVADAERSLIVSGNGDVIEPEDDLMAVGSGGPYAQAAARALLENTGLDAAEIVRKALEIAGGICIYTNRAIVVETLGGPRAR